MFFIQPSSPPPHLHSEQNWKSQVVIMLPFILRCGVSISCRLGVKPSGKAACLCLEFLKAKCIFMSGGNWVIRYIFHIFYPLGLSQGWGKMFIKKSAEPSEMSLQAFLFDATPHYQFSVGGLSKTLLLKAPQSRYRSCTNVYPTKDFPKPWPWFDPNSLSSIRLRAATKGRSLFPPPQLKKD